VSDTPGPSPTQRGRDILATPIVDLPLAGPVEPGSDAHPLAAADPNSITLLFDADPSLLPNGSLDRLIAELRARAESNAASEAAAAAKPKKPTVRATPSSSPALQALRDKGNDLSLDDLLGKA
jgi:hypothetical protein